MAAPAKSHVFLSCVSSEFRSYRLWLANQLGALPGQPYFVQVQEDFQQGGDTLLDKLSDYVRECDLVIHLVGEASGARPTPQHEQTLLAHLGDPTASPPGWSYTQWEYHLARQFNRRVLVYLAQPEAPRNCGRPVPQSDDDVQLQQAHLAHIQNSGEHWKPFTSPLQLVREVFHDLDLEPHVKVNNLPYKSLGSLFKGRDEFLERIRVALGRVEYRGHQRFAAITANATAAAVHGLGGIGKTRAAIEFAHRHADQYTALLFVGADSPGSLQQNLAALCGPLVLDLAEQEARETEVQVAAVLRWLQTHPGWFLIFDNVDTDDAARAVEDLLSQLQSAGQVLVTSRLARWGGDVETLALDVLAEADAADFLLARTDKRRRKTPDDPAQASTLAVELGQLALALEQAGAYIAERSLTLAEYRKEWRERHDKVLEWFDERVMKYPRSVAVTWQTSFDQLGPAARRLLNRLAWFDPAPIPMTLLAVPVPGAADEKSRDALVELEKYSLVSLGDSAEAPTFTVHRLVQDVTRRSLRDDTDRAALNQALRWVDAAFVGDPEDARSWPTLAPLAPHARAASEHADQGSIANPTARLMSQLGQLLDVKSRYNDAEPLYRRTLAIDEALLGPEHPNLARDLNNLAQLLHATNRLAEAEPLMRRALAIAEVSFGPVSPKVATCLNNLAVLLHAMNRIVEAERLLSSALRIDELLFAPEHPSLVIRLSNLAALLQATNRLAEAEPLMRRALAIAEVSFGPVSPKVATCLNNLAVLLHAMNRIVEAEPLMRRALAIDEALLALDHPDVARDLSNLAALLQSTNRLGEAEPLLRSALAIAEAAFGLDHPKVAGILNNLSQLLHATNRPIEAEPLMRRALAIDEASLGPDHPDVARNLNNLGQLLKSTNRLHDAELLYRRALTIDVASLGPDHSNVATDLNNLALLLQVRNRLDEAEPRLRRALAIDEASFGPHHPAVATGLNNLAMLLKAMNQFDVAEPLMRRHLAIFVKFNRATDHEHPHFQAAIGNYRLLLEQMGLSPADVAAKLRDVLGS